MGRSKVDYPDWLEEQRGRKYRIGSEAGFLNRNKLTRKFALHLQSEGRQVTFEAIRSMLEYVDRGYSLHADQISRALGPLYRSTKVSVPKAPNGWTVSIEGKSFNSARAAAEALGVSVQTVLRRLASHDGRWSEWQRD